MLIQTRPSVSCSYLYVFGAFSFESMLRSGHMIGHMTSPLTQTHVKSSYLFLFGSWEIHFILFVLISTHLCDSLLGHATLGCTRWCEFVVCWVIKTKEAVWTCPVSWEHHLVLFFWAFSAAHLQDSTNCLLKHLPFMWNIPFLSHKKEWIIFPQHSSCNNKPKAFCAFVLV